ncbi:ECF-type sigma factor [Wenzhouxiangella marina]|uniref:RNA polymerase sigma 70 n=1 Tax=Wenzhouxiangella marina TaxID=1579979 RepID=A0A0K0XV93_9GAMM|nr:ECF-type sigma factor [Wenzhouxiangella marina]AKS41542.1 RNA polymerase sigma 70 [Wenzhouxiangella marina]MBB6086699.1 RNA polymerase sigma factor (TIGR02999 family) [Wenzhouxiangella marina]
MQDPAAITQCLQRWRGGDQDAFEELAGLVEGQLRELASSRLRGERQVTLQPTALVNEAMLRLMGGDVDWKDRSHFFAFAALHMRSVLVDQARARRAQRRGGNQLQVTLGDELAATSADLGIIELHEALEQLEAVDADAARVIELSYFGGLKRDEVAEAMGCSVSSVFRALRFGQAWLRQALSE